MGKRGPAPKGQYANQSRVFSARLTEELRTAVEAAARDSHRSLSQEIEHRLRRSFDADKQGRPGVFGSRRNYAVFRLIAYTMDRIYRGDWLDSPYAFQQLHKVIELVLHELRPPGEPIAPVSPLLPPDEQEIHRRWLDMAANMLTAEALYAVKNASIDPMPAPKDSLDPVPFIRADLGDAAERIGNQRGTRMGAFTAAEALRGAHEIEQEEQSR